MSTPEINFPAAIKKFDKILERGLCAGVGDRDGQMCIEAAICAALDLPHGDDPLCVASSVRKFKITLNDARWSSPSARAAGLRDLGIAQIGSKGVVEDADFNRILVIKTTQILIPKLFRSLPNATKEMLAAVAECEKNPGAAEAARAARDAEAAEAAGAAPPDTFLLLSASFALDALRELKSPGVAWL